jgi:hypothetical protein
MRFVYVISALGVLLVGLAGCGAESRFLETGRPVNLMPRNHESP